MTIIMLSGQLKEVLFVILRNRRHLHRKKGILSAPNQSYYHTMKLLLATKSLINSKNLDDNANNDGRNRNRNRRTNLELSSSSSLSLSLSLLLYFHRNIQRFLIIISLSSQRRHQHHRSNSTPSIRSSSFLLRRSLLLLVFLQLWLMTFISSYQVRRSSSRIPIPSLSSSSSSSASIRSRQQQQERRRHYSSATSIILSTHSSIFSSSSSSSELAAASSIDSNDNIDDHSSDVVISDDETLVVVKNDDKWRSNLPRDMYASPKLWESHTEFLSFMKQFDIIDDENENDNENNNNNNNDHLWEQVKLEALSSLSTEPEAGPQLYQSILSQGSLVEAIVSTIAHEVETELITATEIKKLFLDMLTEEDIISIHCDVIAAAYRSPSVQLAMLAILFQTGLHTLVCYRVGHRLWQNDRTGLAKYLQSVISKHYSADIHPACTIGQGIYLCTAAGVVIGETATIGNDVSILHGVTLGGTGKELGDRHPKVEHGVVLKDCATILGNIKVGTGSLIMAKSIVTKPVPPLSIMRGVPAKVIATRTLTEDAFDSDLEEHLAFKYLDEWKNL